MGGPLLAEGLAQTVWPSPGLVDTSNRTKVR